MLLTSLQIARFRNLENIHLDFSEGIHILRGANAQGKTNLLEAICYLVTGRSFRTRADSECVPWSGSPEMVSVIKGTFREETNEHAVTVAIAREGKNILLDGKKIERLGDLIGKVKAMLFLPDDLAIAKGAPHERRVFMDSTFSQLSAHYLRQLQRYTTTLRERNALLKTAPIEDHAAPTPRAGSPNGADLQEIESYDQLLIESGVEIYLLRRDMLARLSHHADALHRAIAEHSLALHYINFLETDEDLSRETARNAYADLLEQSRAADMQRGITTIGPHRDDVSLLAGGAAPMQSGFDLRTFGSQGEQRTAAIALRLGCIGLTEELCGQVPILLLDDIFSELDASRGSALLALLTKRPLQTILTTAEPLPFLNDMHGIRSFSIEAGQIREE